jgi:DNA mismatch repair endonuclease MutH
LLPGTAAGRLRWENWRQWRASFRRDLKRDKGWIGILLELWLGASAGSKPEQDFAALGVELKTIPVTALAARWKPPLSASRR